MKTSPLSKVSASVPVGKKSKFNLSHDVNTTYDWGSVQPLFGKLMLPDSSINVNAEQLTRLAPMVVPTFGRVKLKNIAHFIPCQEIYPNWDAMMSQTKVSRPGVANGGPTASVYVPQAVPYLPNSVLAAFVLAGSKVNLYFSGAVGTATENTWYCARNTGSWQTPAGWPAATNAVRAYVFGLLRIANTNAPATSTLAPWNYTGYTFNPRRIIVNNVNGNALVTANGDAFMQMPIISTMMETPLANANGQGYTHSASNEQNQYDSTIGDSHVTMEGADLIWEYSGSDGTGIKHDDRTAGSGTPVENISDGTFDGCKIRLVFKLSSFGKRLRKILIGLGYDVNLCNDDNVSILPLIAFYKAWWDTYAPERYKNFYETNAWKLIQDSMAGARGSDLMFYINQTSAGADLRAHFAGFMADLGTCFATEKQDVISAATDNYYAGSNSTQNENGITYIQSAVNSQLLAILGEGYGSGDTGSLGTLHDGATAPATAVENSMTINISTSPARLTQPQIDSLKKAYVMMNKTSVVGMKVEEILRALGFGDYIEECKGKFIAGSDDNIKISDVVATAATEDSELGQYGGRGLGMGKFQFSFSTNRHGYLIVLSAIVPESGYVNAPAHENEAINFQKMYNPELDGLAYEAIQKKQLTGSPLISDASYRQTFGFLPTYSQWKFMSNKANGDFSLNSRKQSMTPYTLDKYIPVSNANVYRVEEANQHPGSEAALCSPRFTYADLPNAGEDWRYINKFPWNGDFNRIFSEQDDGYEWSVFSPNNNAFLYNSFEFDNFMNHTVFDVAYFAHMKSIEDSYGTYDEEHGAPNTSISRS